jgi:hypothetical protein
LLKTPGPRPEGNFTIVSALNMGASVQYRVVGDLPPLAGAVPAEPGLEDGYVWLMHAQQAQMAGARM